MNRGQMLQDLMLLETLHKDLSIRKQAGLLSGAVASLESYIAPHIDPNSKLDSLINIMGPGAIAMIPGLGWIGLLAGFLMDVFDINLSDIISDIWSGLKSLIGNDQPVSPSQVESVVQSAVQSQAGSSASPTDQSEARTFAQLQQDARMLKLALLDYQQTQLSLTKEAARGSSLFGFLRGQGKAGTTSILARILSVLFRVALMSAGLLVVSGMVKHFLGRDSTPAGSTPTATTPSAPVQSKFPSNPSYSDQTHSGVWTVNVSNDPSSIENMLVSFAQQVYQGLEGKESQITSSPSFQKVLSDLVWYNHASAGDQVVIIPAAYPSKRALVDAFIGDVARAS